MATGQRIEEPPAGEARPEEAGKPPRRFSTVFLTEIAAVLGGLLGTFAYTLGGPQRSWSVFSASIMIAAAALVTGGLVGVLFGVPRSLGAAQKAELGSDSAVPLIGANTNLEQISDWLTKIIVGVTLTQFGPIKREAGQLFQSLAPVLGDAKGAAAFAGSIVIYFLVVGFLAGWLYARLRLGLAMSGADAWLEVSRKADREGDSKTAQVAKEKARSFIQSGSEVEPKEVPADISDLMARYDQVRASSQPGSRRTASMEDLVRRARQAARTEKFTGVDTQALFNLGTGGGRIMALAMMEGDPGAVDFPSVLSAIKNNMSGFEQYHALTVANLIATSLPPEDREQLQTVLRDQEVRESWGSDTSRASLADNILRLLGALASNE